MQNAREADNYFSLINAINPECVCSSACAEASFRKMECQGMHVTDASMQPETHTATWHRAEKHLQGGAFLAPNLRTCRDVLPGTRMGERRCARFLHISGGCGVGHPNTRRPQTDSLRLVRCTPGVGHWFWAFTLLFQGEVRKKSIGPVSSILNRSSQSQSVAPSAFYRNRWLFR
jgi:hypothetical protein